MKLKYIIRREMSLYCGNTVSAILFDTLFRPLIFLLALSLSLCLPLSPYPNIPIEQPSTHVTHSNRRGKISYQDRRECSQCQQSCSEARNAQEAP